MRPRFPGMDPWLEHPGLWPGVHNRLIAAVADDLDSRVAPRYFVEVDQRTYLTSASEDLAVIRPDVLVGRTGSRRKHPRPARAAAGGVGVIERDVELPIPVTVEEWFLEVRAAGTQEVVTVIEILSPANKTVGDGREEYLRKRNQLFQTDTNLVEIDLLRGGRPMPMTATPPVESSYRILISRGTSRPRGKLLAFGIRQAIPTIPIPLLPNDPEPTLDLTAVLHDLYDRAHYDLRLDYKKPPMPPLDPDDAAWARDILAS